MLVNRSAQTHTPGTLFEGFQGVLAIQVVFPHIILQLQTDVELVGVIAIQ